MVEPDYYRVDYYRTLGIQKNATVEQIKAAYRRRAMRLHPDKRPDEPAAEEQFKRCSEAYNVLSNEERRSEYDFQLQVQRTPEMLGEVVSELFGRRRQDSSGHLRITIALTLEEVAKGCRKRVSYAVVQPCAACSERGFHPADTTPCPKCAGKRMHRGNGWMSLPRLCARCGGQGVSVTVLCPSCDGLGSLETERTVEIDLPAGLRDGDQRIVVNQGQPGRRGAVAGDLYVTIRVVPHALFRLVEHDIWLDLPLRWDVAAVGGRVFVPTLDGSVLLTIPSGTQSDTIFRLRGKGMKMDNGAGDLLVRTFVETPVNLGDVQKQLLMQFAQSCTESCWPKNQNFVAVTSLPLRSP